MAGRPSWRNLLDRADVKRLREVLEDHPDAVLGLMTADGIMRWGSPKGSVNIFGRQPKDYVGSRGLDYIHPDDLDEVAAALDRAVQTGESQSVTCRANTADGRWVRLRTVAWSVDGADEGAALVVVISVPQRAPSPLVLAG